MRLRTETDGGVWLIENDCLEAEYSEVDGRIRVRDRRADKSWEFNSEQEERIGQEVFRTERGIRIRRKGKFPLEVTLELDGPAELLFTLSAPADCNMEQLAWPPAVKTPDSGHYLVQTDGEGLLLPADDTGYVLGIRPVYFCGGGPAMAWMGVVDKEMEAGYMAIFETPYDLAIQTERRDGLLTFSPVWLAEKGRFGYERKIRYIFFPRGGYVAQCKRYRDYIWPRNGIESLLEKQKRFPALEKLSGAVHIYVWDQARKTGFAKELKKAGIDKAMILWDPNHKPYPEPEYDDRLQELGYVSGSYELFTDIRHKGAQEEQEVLRELPLVRNIYPGKSEDLTLRKEDGNVYSNEYGIYVCPQAVRGEIIARAEREKELYAHETCFVDVYQANGLYECFHPDHPLTRREYAQEILKNCRLLEETYHLFLGGEFGADYAAAYGTYVHGMMTLQCMWWASAVHRKNTIYDIGDWEDNERPSAMLGTRTATPEYLRYSMNETLRVPLYELVYHDAVITSWRWEDANHHYPELWHKKDLFNILYGSAPLWSIDQDRWEVWKESFTESYRKISPWLERIYGEELVEHRFLTEDRQVQESRFSSGIRVLVNFGDRPCRAKGCEMAPQDFRIIDEYR